MVDQLFTLFCLLCFSIAILIKPTLAARNVTVEGDSSLLRYTGQWHRLRGSNDPVAGNDFRAIQSEGRLEFEFTGTALYIPYPIFPSEASSGSITLDDRDPVRLSLRDIDPRPATVLDSSTTHLVFSATDLQPGPHKLVVTPDPARPFTVFSRLIYTEDVGGQTVLAGPPDATVSEDRPTAGSTKPSNLSDHSIVPIDVEPKSRAAILASAFSVGLVILFALLVAFLHHKRRRERRLQSRLPKTYCNLKNEFDSPRASRKRPNTAHRPPPPAYGSVLGPDVIVPFPSGPGRTRNRQKNSNEASRASDSKRGPPIVPDVDLERRELHESEWAPNPAREARYTMATIYTVSAPPAYEEPSYPLPTLPVPSV